MRYAKNRRHTLAVFALEAPFVASLSPVACSSMVSLWSVISVGGPMSSFETATTGFVENDGEQWDMVCMAYILRDFIGRTMAYCAVQS